MRELAKAVGLGCRMAANLVKDHATLRVDIPRFGTFSGFHVHLLEENAGLKANLMQSQRDLRPCGVYQSFDGIAMEYGTCVNMTAGLTTKG